MKVLFRPPYCLQFLSFLLCLGLLFAFPLKSNAAEIEGFYSIDMEYIAASESDDITDSISVDSGTYLNKACTIYTFPTSDDLMRYVFSYYFEDLNTSHEYSLKFSASSSLSSNNFQVALVFFDSSSGEILKEQSLYACNLDASWTNVDIDFKPDSSGLGGYKTRLEFRFATANSILNYYRLSEIIEFSDKDDNSSWFQKIINAIKEIPEVLSNLDSSINSYISSLGDRVSTSFSDLRDGFSSDINAQTESQGGFFSDLRDKLIAKFEEISSGFTDFFDKFKPRVYESLNWIVGYIKDDDGSFGYSPNNACVTDFLYVSEMNYYLEYLSGGFYYCKVFQYDLQGNFIGLLTSVNKNETVIELPSGYSYRFRLYKGSDLTVYGDELSNYCSQYVRVYADEGWLNSLARLLLNGISGLFIPGDETYFESFYEQWKDLYESKFGIFAQTTTLLSDILLKFSEILSGADGYSFVFPEVSVPIGSDTFVLIEAQTVDMEMLLSEDFVSNLYNIYELSVWAILIYAILRYALKVEGVILGTNYGLKDSDFSDT